VVKWLLRVLLAILAGGLFVLLLISALRLLVHWQTQSRVYFQSAEMPGGAAWPAAVVFGAGYWPGGRPSNALADRLETAIDLYQSGQVSKLLLTGDNRFVDYNEPAVMADYLVARGVPRENLVLDYAGRRTYDSCFRAKVIFGLERAVLVTQRFHLPRALFTCERLGLESVGVVADKRHYVRGGWYDLRELFALTRAWFDVNLLKPLPVLGDPIAIDWYTRAAGD